MSAGFCRTYRKSSRLLMAGAITFLASIFMSTGAMAQLANDTVTVDVTVTAVSEITVTPTTLSFTATPGTADSETIVDITNTGSLNVSRIYMYMDTLTKENVRPYGSAAAESYAAGSVIFVKNKTNSTIYPAGRLEWNETEDVSNMVKTAVTTPVAWGFYRNLTQEYNWLVGNGTANCTAGAEFAIEDDVDLGTAATRTPTTTDIALSGSDGNWSYFAIGGSRTPLKDSCVAVFHDCTKIFVYKYDGRNGVSNTTGDFQTCGNFDYLQSPNLQPGQVHSINVTAYIPLGVPSGGTGNLNQSVLTVFAQAGV